MSYFGQQFLNGIGSGAIYASLGLALVLIYRATNIVNFAQGEMGAFSAFLIWQLQQWGVPIILALIGAIILSMLIGGLVYAIVVRPVQNREEVTIVIVTIGLFLGFNSASGAIWGYLQKALPSPFPAVTWYLGGLRISGDLVGTCILLAAIVLGLYLLFQHTKIGLTLRAAASNAESSMLVGVPFIWMMIVGWGLSAGVGAISGALVAPHLSLDPNMMITVIIYAFAAAVLGGLASYSGAIVGGLLVGVSQSLTTAYLPSLGADLQVIVPLGIMVAVLAIKPEGLFGRSVMARV